MIQPLRHGSAPDRDQVLPRDADLLFQQLEGLEDAVICLTATELPRNVTRFFPMRPNSYSSLRSAMQKLSLFLLTATESLMTVTRFLPLMPNSCPSSWCAVPVVGGP